MLVATSILMLLRSRFRGRGALSMESRRTGCHQVRPEDENDNGLKENVCRGEKELENDEGVELRTRRHYQEVGQEAWQSGGSVAKRKQDNKAVVRGGSGVGGGGGRRRGGGGGEAGGEAAGGGEEAEYEHEEQGHWHCEQDGGDLNHICEVPSHGTGV